MSLNFQYVFRRNWNGKDTRAFACLFLIFSFFNVFRWGKERPLNTRLLIQNVELPTYDVEAVPGLKGSDDEASWDVQVFRSITSDSAR